MIHSNSQEGVVCPHCGLVQYGPRQVRFRLSKPTHKILNFSDFHHIDVVSVKPPDFLICSCGSVQNFFDCQPSAEADAPRRQRWVAASTEQVLAAVEKLQPPFTNSEYSHHARLWVWRCENKRIAEGFPITDLERRTRLLQKLENDFLERSMSAVYRYLRWEKARQSRMFEEAAQGFRALIDDNEIDKHLRRSAQQNLDFCHCRSTLQQLLVQPEWTRTPTGETKSVSRKRADKLVLGVSDVELTNRISAWVNFPSGVFNLSDLKYLPTILKTNDPIFSGVIVLVSDLARNWAPGDTRSIGAFILALESIHRATPWLLLDTGGDSKPWVAALRGARFHASSIGVGSVEADRFANWLRFAGLRASRGNRRLKKAGCEVNA